ncbi:efflux RND transporter periplasmic adaptor subunit [Salidesulfovibrio onnuriiensis]|uniref:efflux RND transporter periplasmic adaptor subunit n=1 Tax=Salidesulfovibrio onnuriiensis TaxID=2583823 RepID=UPI0016500607|nr:efflux RND transporter periplasmic adaptor subunit [Salidesulfovibrio onnuriiensis]
MAIATQKADKFTITTQFEAAPGREFTLKLKEFSLEADPQTQTYRVRLFMPSPETKVRILPGMTTTVILRYSGGTAEGYSVPVGAVLDEDGKAFVWKVGQDMTVTKSPVKVGLMAGESISVVEGLKEGDRIATAGVHYLREGQKVRELTGKIGD